MTRLVDVDDTPAETLFQLASNRRLQELTPPSPPTSTPDPETGAAFDRLVYAPRPALGAFPRRDTPDAPSVDQWLRDDPRRLAGVIVEAARFTDDLKCIVVGVTNLADRVGIDEEEADKIIAAAIRLLQRGTRAG